MNPDLQILFLFVLLAVPFTHAAQYESQYREVDPSAAQEVQITDPEKILEQVRGNPYAEALAYQQIGAKAAQAGDYDKAATSFEKAIATGALPAEVQQGLRDNLVQLYGASDDPKMVIEKFGPWLRKAKNPDADMYMVLANAYLQLNRHKEAIAPIEKALKLSEDPDPETWMLLASVQLKLKQYAKAERPIKQAIKLDSDPPEKWYKLLLAVNLKQKDYKGAAAVLELLMQRWPGEREYWFQLASLQVKAKRYKRALAVLRLADRQGMLINADERLQLVRMFVQAKAPYYAAVLMQEALDGGHLSRTAANWELAAGSWLRAKEGEKAIAALERAVAVKKKFALLMQLGQLYLDYGRWQQAIDTLKLAIRQGGPEKLIGPAWLSVGMAYFQQGNFDKAREAFDLASGFGSARAGAKGWLQYLDSPAAKRQSSQRTAAVLTTMQESAAEAKYTQNVAFSDGYQRPPDAPSARSSGSPSRKQRERRRETQRSAAAAAKPVVVDSPFVAAALGDGRTPIGARQAANADGSIPAWEGGITSVPSGYKKGGELMDPFPADRVSFVVDGANAAQHGKLLSDGHKRLLSQAGYRMPVFETRRTASYPQAIYDATVRNAAKAKLIGTEAIANAELGFPFPKPDVGAQVIWNHKVRYRSNDLRAVFTSGTVWPDGKRKLQESKVEILFAYGNLTERVNTDEDNRLLYYFGEVLEPPREAGLMVLVHEPADHRRQTRAIWVGKKGLPKVIRAPFVGYDFPIDGGTIFVDQIDMYNGAFDYYSWRIAGKREMLIPYNSYRVGAESVDRDALLAPRHFNPEHTRYEKHRVWVVEADLRKGEAHKFTRRVFYVDEDSWTIALVENYNADGELWKFQEFHIVNHYHVPMVSGAPMVVYDFVEDFYYASNVGNGHPPPRFNDKPFRGSHFKPSTLKRRLQR